MSKNYRAELVGLFGNPVDENPTGPMMEAGFEAQGLNYRYITMKVEKENLKDAKAYDSFQFVRQGFFCVDAKDSTADHLVFNRIVSLKSSFKLPNA